MEDQEFPRILHLIKLARREPAESLLAEIFDGEPIAPESLAELRDFVLRRFSQSGDIQARVLAAIAAADPTLLPPATPTTGLLEELVQEGRISREDLQRVRGEN